MTDCDTADFAMEVNIAAHTSLRQAEKGAVTCIPQNKSWHLISVSRWDYAALRPCRLDFRETPWPSA